MNNSRRESYGQKELTFVDRFGVWLSGRAIARELPARTDLEVLELGCGFQARHLVDLSPRLKRGTGLDFQIAPELHQHGKLEFHEGAIEETLPKISEQSFDVVLLISVLEHLHHPLSVLLAVRKLLKPSGVVLINVPTWRGKKFLEFSAFRLGLSPRAEMEDHKMYYDKRDLWPLLVRAGFKPSELTLRYHKFGLNLFAVARLEHV